MRKMQNNRKAQSWNRKLSSLLSMGKERNNEFFSLVFKISSYTTSQIKLTISNAQLHRISKVEKSYL